MLIYIHVLIIFKGSHNAAFAIKYLLEMKLKILKMLLIIFKNIYSVYGLIDYTK